MITVLLLCLASGVLHSQRRNTWSYIAPSLTHITWSSANKSWIQILHVNRDLRDKYVQQYSSRQLLRLVVYYPIMCPFPPQAFSLHTINHLILWNTERFVWVGLESDSLKAKSRILSTTERPGKKDHFGRETSANAFHTECGKVCTALRKCFLLLNLRSFFSRALLLKEPIPSFHVLCL